MFALEGKILILYVFRSKMRRIRGEMFFTTRLFTFHFPVEAFCQYNPFTISSCWFLPTDRCLETFSVLSFEMKVAHPWNIHNQLAAVGHRLTVLLVSISPLCKTNLNFADHTQGSQKILLPRCFGRTAAFCSSSSFPPGCTHGPGHGHCSCTLWIWLLWVFS